MYHVAANGNNNNEQVEMMKESEEAMMSEVKVGRERWWEEGEASEKWAEAMEKAAGRQAMRGNLEVMMMVMIRRGVDDDDGDGEIDVTVMVSVMCGLWPVMMTVMWENRDGVMWSGRLSAIV